MCRTFSFLFAYIIALSLSSPHLFSFYSLVFLLWCFGWIAKGVIIVLKCITWNRKFIHFSNANQNLPYLFSFSWEIIYIYCFLQITIFCVIVDMYCMLVCSMDGVHHWILQGILFLADVKTATKNKVPLVRSLTLNWLTFCIETSNKAAILKVHKDYVPICMEVGILPLRPHWYNVSFSWTVVSLMCQYLCAWLYFLLHCMSWHEIFVNLVVVFSQFWTMIFNNAFKVRNCN